MSQFHPSGLYLLLSEVYDKLYWMLLDQNLPERVELES